MKTYIVLIPLEENNDARKQCELIENHTFDTNANLNSIEVRKEIIKLINDNTYDLSQIEVEPITDFMERFNDEELNPDNYFMSYVYA